MRPMTFCRALFGGGAEDAAFEEAVEVEGAREEVVAGGFGDRAGFAGEVGFVAGALASGDAEIDGDLASAGDADGLARAEGGDGGFDFETRVVEDRGHLRSAPEQRADLLLGAAFRVVLHRPGGAEQEEEQRALVPRADGGGTDRDGEHEEVNVQRTRADLLPGFLDGFPRAEDVAGQPEGEGDFPGRAQAFGGEARQTGEKAAGGLEGDGAPFVGTMDVIVGVGVFVVAVGMGVFLPDGEERHLAGDELRPAEVLPAPEMDGGRAGLFFDERVAHDLLEHDAALVETGFHRLAALGAVALRVLDRATGVGGLVEGILDALGEAAARVVAEGGHREFAAAGLEGDGFQARFLGEDAGDVFHGAIGTRGGGSGSRGSGWAAGGRRDFFHRQTVRSGRVKSGRRRRCEYRLSWHKVPLETSSPRWQASSFPVWDNSCRAGWWPPSSFSCCPGCG